jgi:hypothetical protein
MATLLRSNGRLPRAIHCHRQIVITSGYTVEHVAAVMRATLVELARTEALTYPLIGALDPAAHEAGTLPSHRPVNAIGAASQRKRRRVDDAVTRELPRLLLCPAIGSNRSGGDFASRRQESGGLRLTYRSDGVQRQEDDHNNRYCSCHGRSLAASAGQQVIDAVEMWLRNE